MKKQLRKVALAVVFAMAVALIAPAAQVAEAAVRKEFTYAEQISGDRVTKLAMNKGEKIDLKFNGVSNWKTYKYKWISSNPKVAVVDSAGLITAIGEGVATIKLTVSGGDGTEYTSQGVTVYVDSLKQNVTIGTASQEEIKSYTMEMGKNAVLKANGLIDNLGGRYTFDWSCTDTSVARINDEGVVTPVAPGLAVIQLTATKVSSGEKFEATPIALLVTGSDYSVPATATPVPTKAPSATPTSTPVPTQKPGATATPSPTPTVPAGAQQGAAFSVTQDSDRSVILTFGESVDYEAKDVAFQEILDIAGYGELPTTKQVAKVTLDSTKRQLRVELEDSLTNATKYRVTIGNVSRDVVARIGAPTHVEVSYSCLGKENVAYAYDESVNIDVPVKLTYRLMYGNIDVTETYNSMNSYVSYEYSNSNYDSEYVNLDGDTLSFYKSGVTASLRAVFSYYDEENEYKEVKTGISIRSQKLPTYSIEATHKYTVIDENDYTFTDINWEKTNSKVIANSSGRGAKLVVMLKDTYGNYYVNDDRAVDEENKIYSISDPDQLFFQMGYGLEFEATNMDVIYVGSDGFMLPFDKTTALVLVKLTNDGTSGNNFSTKTLTTCAVQVLEESKLNSISFKDSSVTLASSALYGYEERFCEAELEILLKDQYGNEWDGNCDFEVTCTNSTVNDALDNSTSSPARIMDGKLIVSATNIKAVTKLTSLTFNVKETTSNKTARLTVKLQSPSLTNGAINVNSWLLEPDTEKVTVGEAKDENYIQSVTLEAFKVSGTGKVKVGLYDDLNYLNTLNPSFSPSKCRVDQVYVVVKAPDGSVVEEADDANSLGVYIDHSEGCVRVNVSAPTTTGSLTLDSLPEGRYSVTAYRITDVGTTVKNTRLTTYFTVEDNTKNVTLSSYGYTTPINVSSQYDIQSVKEIVVSAYKFNLGGVAWNTLTTNMISDVEFSMKSNGVIFIDSVEFAIPLDPTKEYGYSYVKRCKIQKAISTGVNR